MLQAGAQRDPEQIGRQPASGAQNQALGVLVRVDRIILEEPALDRAERRVAPHRALRRGRRRGRGRSRTQLDHPGELGDGGMLEDLPDGQAHPVPTGARDELDASDRVAAELEEVVVRADLRAPQHLGEQLGQLPLERAGRRDVRGPAVELGARVGQGGAIDLSARQERERGEHHRGRRHHRVGQALAQMHPQLGRADRSHHVGHESLAGGALAQGDRGPLHRRMPPERRLDLGQLDALATQLDLVIASTQKLETAVVAPPHPVARAVHPAVAGAREGAGAHQPGQALVGQLRFERDIGPARGQNGQERGNPLAGALEENADAHLGSHPAGGEGAR